MADQNSSAIGNIKEFNLNTDTWSSYIKRIKAFFTVNNIKVNVQTSYLITLVGNETYDLMTVLCSPDEPENKTFDELVDIVEKHINPKASDMAERMKLRACLQNQSETVNEYLLRLKKLAMTCKFKGQESLEENLREQFTYGLWNEKYRQRLLTERELSFTRAVTLATSLEAAELEAKLGGGKNQAGETSNSAGVYAVRSGGGGGGAGAARGARASAGRGSGASSQRSTQAGGDRCYRCGSRQHSADKCGFKSAMCYKCDKIGHISHMCRNKKSQRVFQVANSDSEGDGESPTLYRLSDGQESDSPWYCKLNVEGVMLNMQIDSGSSVSAISKDTYNRLFKGRPLIESNKVLTVYSGEKIKPLGIMPVNVINSDQSFTSKLYVLDNGNCPPIIGRKWMRHLKISLPMIAQVSCNDNESVINEIVRKYSNVFAPGMGTFNRGTISLQVCAGARPVWRRARVVPHALRPAVDAELARLEAEGVISPVEDVGGWGTPIVPVRKQNGTIRICGDFKVTVNPVLSDDKYPLPRIEDLFSSLRGEGLHTETKKIDAVLAAERPQDVSELRAFLGLINYYSKFVRNFSTVVAPLYSLLKKHKTWEWSTECEMAFVKIKELLKNSEILMHFDPDLPLVLSCDASPRGVGAWLGHELPDGRVRAVAHASRTLSSAEQNYSQICREDNHSPIFDEGYPNVNNELSVTPTRKSRTPLPSPTGKPTSPHSPPYEEAENDMNSTQGSPPSSPSNLIDNDRDCEYDNVNTRRGNRINVSYDLE
ncbi:uncharacterized protein LOC135078624 [Ostrinia nubilalis]|uniref:uncharacterized protein LOC135078624 n=1 Tax=Ostrinia nubilalis TaxID=29057 RepID=UPI0030824600